MAKVKVHELAKELNIQSKDIINFLAEKNIDVKAPSNLDDEKISMVKGRFQRGNAKEISDAAVTAQLAVSQSERAKVIHIEHRAANTEQKTDTKETKDLKTGTETKATTEAKAGMENKVAADAKESTQDTVAQAKAGMENKVAADAKEGTQDKIAIPPKAEDKPKKKSSITAVFNPQHSKMGGARTNGSRDKNGRGQRTNVPSRQIGSTTTGRPAREQSIGGVAQSADRQAENKPTTVNAQTVDRPTGEQPTETNHVAANANRTNASDTNANRTNASDTNANRANASDTNTSGTSNENATSNTNVANTTNNHPSEDRPAYNSNRPTGDRPAYNSNRPTGDRPAYNSNRPTGDRPAYNSNRPTGDRPAYNSNRPAGDRPTYSNNRPAGDRPAYSNNRPAGDRPAYNNNRPTGDRPAYSNNRPAGDRPAYNSNRPAGDRPAYNNNRSTYNNSRPTGDRPAYNNNRPAGDRPVYNNNRPAYNSNRPTGDRPTYSNNRPAGDRPAYNNNRPAGDRPYGNRPYSSSSERGARPSYDRGNSQNYQSGRPAGNRPPGDKSTQRAGESRPSQQTGSRFEQGINKSNQRPAGATSGDTKSRDGRKGFSNGLKSARGVIPKRQERYVNLEKHGGRRKKPQTAPVVVEKEETIKTIVLPESLTIKELAEKMKLQASAIVKKLFLQGKVVTINEEVEYSDAEEIALEYNCICEPEVKIDIIEELLKEEAEDESAMVKRPPVVCVMGHVDHGKTSLLDAIRDTHVIDREAGGITQHIGAYIVTCNGEKITFLDTPGHEAFTAMRMRGAIATDFAILVVAADDGVMPQTIEAISHAKAAGVEIIVAINKIDKPSANIERVKQELSEYELIPEDWGGSTIFVPVSAHTHEGIEQLLEMILLTAEVSELKADPKRQARGLVIEAQLDKGRGAVATILVQKGTLRVGQSVAAGSCYGKVRAMIDDKGRRVSEAGPSKPVEILGLNNVPNAGDIFVCTESEKEAKNFAETFISHGREKLLDDTKAKMSLDDLFTQIKSGNLKELGIVVKADVQGSVEAVKQSLVKLSNEEVVVKIVHGGVGAINESDVSLASTSNAIIIGFNVRPDATAKATAEREGVDLRLYKVIYNAIEDVQAAMKGMLDPIFEEKILGHAEVRQIFKASGVGNIAGSYVLDGVFQRGCKVRIKREDKQIFEGTLGSLKRFKDDVKEVKTGYECGLVFDGFSEIEELDIVEAYTMVEVPR
ncbi:translation initiation factor IF-2 [Lachnospiraceae bacterium ZAX-1]